MLEGVPPSKQYCQLSQAPGYRFTGFLVVFVPDFESIYDSLNPQAETSLLYKLMIICGNLLSFNAGKATPVTWIEESRSTDLQAD